MYPVTPKNIRLRYLAAKDDARIHGGVFTYETMGDLFMVSGQACYMWTLPKGVKAHRRPSGARRVAAVIKWINDGRLDAYLARLKATAKEGA